MKSKPKSQSIFSRFKLIWILFTFSLTFQAYAENVTHKEVIAALEWELPANECLKPKLIAQSSNIVDSEGARAITDVDSYTIGRYNRKEKRWRKCVQNYKEELMKDFQKLRGSAKYGLTQDQANAILAKMALIQRIYLSADGLPEETVEEATD